MIGFYLAFIDFGLWSRGDEVEFFDVEAWLEASSMIGVHGEICLFSHDL